MRTAAYNASWIISLSAMVTPGIVDQQHAEFLGAFECHDHGHDRSPHRPRRLVVCELRHGLRREVGFQRQPVDLSFGVDILAYLRVDERANLPRQVAINIRQIASGRSDAQLNDVSHLVVVLSFVSALVASATS